MQPFLLVILLLLALFLFLVIFIQNTALYSFGVIFGGSTMGGLFTARGSANIITRTTAILATFFILNSLALGYLASSQHQSRSLIDQIEPAMAPAVEKTAAPQKAPEPKAPEVPQVPVEK
jgi:preprotein translocase subunit SecG